MSKKTTTGALSKSVGFPGTDQVKPPFIGPTSYMKDGKLVEASFEEFWADQEKRSRDKK